MLIIGASMFIRRLYREMVTRPPWLYDAIMRAWPRHPRLFERLSSIGQSGYIHGLQRELDAFEPDVIVSTYNFAGQLLTQRHGWRQRVDGRSLAGGLAGRWPVLAGVPRGRAFRPPTG
jgi:hypothetical protein